MASALAKDTADLLVLDVLNTFHRGWSLSRDYLAANVASAQRVDGDPTHIVIRNFDFGIYTPAVSVSLSQCFESNARLVFASHGVISPGPWLPSPVTLLVPGLCIVLVIILSSSLCRFLCLARRYCLDYVFSLPLVGSVQPAYISVTKRLVTCLVHQEALLLTVSRSMWCARDTALANCAMLRPGTHGWSHVQFLTVTTEHKHANRLQRSSDCGASPRL